MATPLEVASVVRPETISTVHTSAGVLHIPHLLDPAAPVASVALVGSGDSLGVTCFLLSSNRAKGNRHYNVNVCGDPMSATTHLRRKLQRVGEAGRAVRRLVDTGIIDLTELKSSVEVAKHSRIYGPQATMAIQGGRRYANLPAIVDERGTLTYKQVDDQSWALAHGLQELGVSEGSVVGVLCRDHRGLVLAMAACGKLGARMVLMNTGFAKPQFAEVCEREKVTVVLHDSEFLGLLDALHAELPRVLTWVDDGAELPAQAHILDEILATNSTEPLPPPSKSGGSVILTSGTTGLPKGAPRDSVKPLATAQIIDRIPFPRKGTMAIMSPIFHSTGWATYTVGAALGNQILTTRRFKAEGTLALIADHRADMLVAVPTMLHRIVELGADVIAKYDTSSLKVILVAGSALSPDCRNGCRTCSATCSTTCTAPPSARSPQWPRPRNCAPHREPRAVPR